MQGDERAQTTMVSRTVVHSLPAHFGFTDGGDLVSNGGSQTESCLSLLSVVGH